jgi:hypothetical protein
MSSPIAAPTTPPLIEPSELGASSVNFPSTDMLASEYLKEAFSTANEEYESAIISRKYVSEEVSFLEA